MTRGHYGSQTPQLAAPLTVPLTATIMGLLIAGFGGLAAAQTPGPGLQPFKVLMIQGTSSDHTPSSNAAKPILTAMAEANGFTIDFSSDHSLINDATLAKYQVFLQMNLYPFDLTASERTAFQKYVESGKAWVGVHSSGCANNAWPWFSKFLGDITFVSHAALRSGGLIFEDRTHPVTRNMPATLTIRDEWYQFSKSPRAKVKVLAKAEERNYSPYNANGDHPMVWVLPDYERAVYVSIGHDPGDWQVADYVKLIRDAIIWAGASSPTGVGVAGGGNAYLGPPLRGRVWFRNGILTLDPDGSGWAGRQFGLRYAGLADAAGRRLPLIAEGGRSSRSK